MENNGGSRTTKTANGIAHAAPDGAPVLLLTAAQASKALALSPRKLWSLTAPRGPISAVRIGRAVRYSLDDLRNFIVAQSQGGA